MLTRILVGDCVERLRELPKKSVHCCVTSPPYWGLRDYGMPGQIGVEEHPEDFLSRLVDVFREVRRVLRDDGTLWLNLGDSYAGSAASGGDSSPDSLKPKDLCGIPWRVAFALQSDGWWLRQDIIWHKPSPMPESVTDRCTKAHEYVFLLAKRERYFYDAEAIKEDSVTGSNGSSFTSKYDRETKHGLGLGERQETVHRNRRSVWTISTKPYRGAHFATMPVDLAEDCIKAGTSEHGCCAECGAPFHRVTEKRQLKRERPNQYVKRNGEAGTGNSCANDVAGVECVTVGWRPVCNCTWSEPVPCTVLDPFGGAGTTALAAARLGRQAVICELNPKYAQMAKERIRDDSPLANVVELNGVT